MLMLELVKAVRGRLIGPKLGSNYYDFWSYFYSSRTSCVDCVGCCVMVYVLNHVVMCVRPGSTEKYEFTKRIDDLCLIGTVNEGFTVLETVISQNIICENMGLIK